MNPHLIASGLGLADRNEIAGLLAICDASNLIDAGVSVGTNLLSRLGLEMRKQGERVAEHAAAHVSSDRSDDELRHMLWLKLTRGLDIGAQFPLSERKTAEVAAALGVMTSTTLSHSLHLEARRRHEDDTERTKDWSAWAKKQFQNARGRWSREPPLPFPEIVSRELVRLMNTEELRGGMDPDAAKTLEKAGNEALAILAAGGGWVGIAAMVSSAGFAPYMFAAQASAFIPFMSGPAVVSLLAVLVNPATIVAVLAAAGGAGGIKISNAIRKQVAARIAVLLAVRGTADPTKGMADFVDSLRNVTRPGASDLGYLSLAERRELRQRVLRIEGRIGRDLPKAVGLPPGDLREPPLPHQRGNDLDDAVAIAGLTTGEMLYRAATIDDRVIQAADFWRAADLSHPFAFAAHAHELQAAGADIALRGYVAEQIVMDQLIAEGHAVSRPDMANQPGYDLIVNGQQVQVKCGADLGLLREHFETYPDIPVIVNAELMKAASGEPWSNMVGTVEGFELQAIETIRDQALDAGVDLAATDVLASAIGLGAIRGAIAVMRGEIPARDLPAWLVVDAALKIPILGIGGKAGSVVGLIAIGPAGALVLGPLGGIAAMLGMGPAKTAFDRLANRSWHKALQAEGETLHTALTASLSMRARCVQDRTLRLNAAFAEISPDLRTWIDLRACEDSIFAIELLEELPSPPKAPTDAMSLIVEASRTAPADPAVMRARAALQQRLERRPGPLDGVGDLWAGVRVRSPLKS